MGFGDHSIGNVLDIAFASMNGIKLGLVNIKAQYLDADFGKANGQRQADVAQANDTDDGVA